jgi:nitrogen regulatory protein PII-like uncharacterized protein
MEDNKLENTYESKSIITRIYFRWKVKSAINLARLTKKDIILDFGCGDGWLERNLIKYQIYGYDINPSKTFIDEYRKINPTKIFVLDVFEHIPITEIEKIIESFKDMSKKFLLIVSIPTENLVSRKIRKLVGKTEIPKEHITKHKDIIKLLKKNFILKKRINFFSVSHILLLEHNNLLN